MKIGLLTQRHLLGFGVDLVVHKMAYYLSKFGHEVIVFTNLVSEAYPEINYQLIHLPIEMHESPLKNYELSKYYLNLIKSYKCDVLIFHTLPFFYALEDFKNEKKIIIEYGTSDTIFFPLEKKINFLLNDYITKKYFYKYSDKIFPISQFLADRLPDFLKSKTKIIPLAADHYTNNVSLEDVEEEKKRLGIAKDEKILLYVGRLNYEAQPYKNTKELIETYHIVKSIYKKVKLIMVGYGSEKDKEYLKSENIIPIVNAPYEKMALYYELSDIYITATLWEGFDLPLLEAQYFGKPVVAYYIGAHPEVCLNNKTGFLVLSQKEFVKKILSLLENSLLYKYMSLEAKRFAKNFSWEKTVRTYENEIYSLLKKENYLNGQKELISIIILNYNTPYKVLEKNLKSIYEQTYQNFEVLLIDNNSKIKSYKNLPQEFFAKVKIIENNKNLGFSKAINEGIKKATGKWILILNNDTYLDKYCLEVFVKNKDKYPENVVGFAPKMYLAGEYKVLDSIGNAVNEKGEAYNIGIGEIDIGQYDKSSRVMGVCFGGCFVKKEAFEKIGYLDESYQMYYEDVDWSIRANLLGYKFYTLPKSIIYHYHSASLRNTGYEWKYKLIERNLLKTVYKNFSKERTVKILKKRIKNYLNTDKKDYNYMCANLEIIKEFKKSLDKLEIINSKIESAKVEREDNLFIINIPPKRCFFIPITYRVEYTAENLYYSLQKKLINGLKLSNSELFVFNYLKEKDELSFLNGDEKQYLIEKIENLSLKNIIFNLHPFNVNNLHGISIITGENLTQIFNQFPVSFIKSVSIFLNNQEKKYNGKIKMVLETENKKMEKVLALKDTAQNYWLDFEIKMFIANKYLKITLKYISNTPMRLESPFIAVYPYIYPETFLYKNNEKLKENIIFKFNFEE